MGIRRCSAFRLASLTIVALPALPSALSAQAGDSTAAAVPTVRVLVEYVGGTDLYIDAGSEEGLAVADTLTVRSVRLALSGRVRVIQSTEQQSVIAFVGQPFPVTRGDSLDLQLSLGPTVAAAALSDAPPAQDSAGDASRRDSESAQAREYSVSSGVQSAAAQLPAGSQLVRRPRLAGSLSLDLDAVMSKPTGGIPEDVGEAWSFLTPTLRLQATASELPGNARVSFYGSWTGSYAFGEPLPAYNDRFRLYQLEVEKAFDAVPVQMRAGRFHERHDSWSGYLDGLSVRMGGSGDGFGVGVAAGTTPLAAEQTPFTGGARATVFADYGYRASEFAYQADIALTARSTADTTTERYVGLIQRVRIGMASVYQRARITMGPGTGDPSLAELDLLSSVPIGTGWTVRGLYSRRRLDWTTLGSLTTEAERRQRIGLGVSWYGSTGTLSLDVQATDRTDQPIAPLYSASIDLPRLLGGALGITADASMNRDALARSVYVAPGLSIQSRALSGSAGWRLYNTRTDLQETRTQGPWLSLYFPVRSGLHASIRGDAMFGSGSSSQRLFVGLWAPFR